MLFKFGMNLSISYMPEWDFCGDDLYDPYVLDSDLNHLDNVTSLNSVLLSQAISLQSFVTDTCANSDN